MNTFIFTCGDINGIGPELIIKSLNKLHTLPDKRFIVLIPYNVFELTAGIVKPEFNFNVSKEAGKTAYSAIKTSYKMLFEKKADAVITAPISKTAIHKYGIKFPGHT